MDVVEDQYSLIHREAEQELFPYLRENNISFVPFFPLASGLLTGKYTKELSFPEGDIRSENPDFKGERFERIIDKVNEVSKIAKTHDVSTAQLVLAWYMKNPDITVVIPGAKKAEQVASNAKAMQVILSNDEYDKINAIFE
ncbi:aldo keto reductase [Apilactobacillus ozensis DSM 23829 = JCM 17196]|uniref:Aldo keto reductase n=1 Tax=Apilactobacillus ozensis DSM 23829 = JCM 17196 TaxID=1423781 RepID=A0A0R2ARB8_9LACO|nr:aldo keto reductase [Apilactobacillus ozensis DSM 23829 = JCM 17196]